jgi:hypothetical protein
MMIRTLTAYTENIDDSAAAIADLRTQLDIEHKLLKNSVGILACHYEFVNSGAVKAICEAMPFDVLGDISSVQGTSEAGGALFFSLMVITSDTVTFKTALSSSLKGIPGKAVEETYKAATSGSETKPSLIFVFAPFIVENSGDEYVQVLADASGGVPCFGTLAVDDTADFHACYMIYKGDHYRDRMSLILCYGEICPRFYLATISKDKILEQSAKITTSEGHILKEVNGRPVVKFFEALGLTKASQSAYAMTSLPFMLDYNDGTPPVSRVFIALNEQQEAICAGAMPEEAILYIGIFDKDDVLLTTGKALADALAGSEDAAGILIYSCISRGMTLGSELLGELELARKLVAGKTPFLMAYSGGEICPTFVARRGADGNAAVNRFHNNTFTLCIFS